MSKIRQVMVMKTLSEQLMIGFFDYICEIITLLSF
jgi:hypothetical protein